MASIRKRGTRWQVQIRRQGFPTISRSFSAKSDAQEWARHWEAKADRGDLPENRKALEQTTLRELVTRYRDEIVPRKRGSEIETIMLNRFLRDSICRKTLAQLSTGDFAAFRDRRLREITPRSFARQLSPIRNMFNVARIEWNLPIFENPLSALKIPADTCRRERRLRVGELNRLMKASQRNRNPYVLPVALFAIETAMRRGEILALRWDHLDVERRSLRIPETKNGYPRTIPLSSKAIAIVCDLEKREKEVFPISATSLRLAWHRLTTRAGLDDLHFHDLRHEAISRFFERGLTVPEVASISGHRDIRMLMGYAHANVSILVKKLE